MDLVDGQGAAVEGVDHERERRALFGDLNDLLGVVRGQAGLVGEPLGGGVDPVSDPVAVLEGSFGDLDEAGIQQVERAGDLGDFGFDADRVGPIRGTDR